MKYIALGELAQKRGVNKSKLSYFFSVGLIKPVMNVGRLNVYDEVETVKILNKIDKMKSDKKTLKEIKKILK